MLPEPESPLAAALARSGERLLLPDFWLGEATNVLWVAARRGRLTREAARAGLELLRTAVSPISTAGWDLYPRALELSLLLDHPAYDTLYLAFAIATGARAVVVADAPFIGAVRRHPDPAVAGMVIPLEEWARAAGHSVWPRVVRARVAGLAPPAVPAREVSRERRARPPPPRPHLTRRG